jgi:hypothetical protein
MVKGLSHFWRKNIMCEDMDVSMKRKGYTYKQRIVFIRYIKPARTGSEVEEYFDVSVEDKKEEL